MLFCGNNLIAQTYRTKPDSSGETYSINLRDNAHTDKLTVSINLFNRLRSPTLNKEWNPHVRAYCYTGYNDKFKFIVQPAAGNNGNVRDSNGKITRLYLSIFHYANGFDKIFTEKLFDEVYYLAN